MSLLVFVVVLPIGFFIGITLIGHVRPLPYFSVWIDRLVLVAIALGLPALAAFGLYRFLTKRSVSDRAGRP
jgi:uncharacterized BrkB/YihY/UPF0761 family membrane protein